MPSRLGRYVVQRRIGSGGFATVWLAYDEQLDSPVAVKVLAENWTEDAHIRRRFLEEGRYLRRVESAHVVTVYDAGELEDGRPYLVMTYADQGTLADRVESCDVDDTRTGLTTSQALEVVRQVAAGLQALHDRDILHRDVKPANVLFRTTANGTDVRAMVGDLGLGKALDVSSRLTMIAGTPSYVAPEQAAAEPVDARADQYSLAALAYLMLAGRPPFSHADLKAAANPGAVPPLSTDERPFADEVDEVLRRGLARDPRDRYPSVTEFAEALASALAATTGELPAASAPGHPWLPIDAERTQVGARPTAVPVAHPTGQSGQPVGSGALAVLDEPVDDLAAASQRRSRHPLLIAGIAALAVIVGLGAGLAAYAVRHGEKQPAPAPTTDTLIDDSGVLGVTVPSTWSARSLSGWKPPKQGHDAAISAGTSPHWASDGGDGVFLGLIAADKLPSAVPRVRECRGADAPLTIGATIMQRTFSGCPGGVVIERVEQVANGLLLWVQVSAPTRAEAGTVLDSAHTIGL